MIAQSWAVYSFMNDGFVDGSDYEKINDTLTLKPQDKRVNKSACIIDDTVLEPLGEKFLIRLKLADATFQNTVSITDNNETVLIVDDDG